MQTVCENSICGKLYCPDRTLLLADEEMINKKHKVTEWRKSTNYSTTKAQIKCVETNKFIINLDQAHSFLM